MKRPLLLTLGTYVSLVLGVLMTVTLALAPLNVGTFSYSGRAVSGPEFMRSGGWWLFIPALMLLGIAVGLLAARPWSRVLMAAWWPLVFLGVALDPANGESVWSSLFWALLPGVSAVMYLYGSGHVNAYYAALRPMRESQTRGGPFGHAAEPSVAANGGPELH
jgi:hypothetical protein